jgi:hypothetical protein
LVYPNDTCAYAYNATVLNCTDGASTVSNVVSSPVQLTVGQPDMLVSDIINLTSTSREFEYYFAPPNEQGSNLWLGGRQVKIKINNTEFSCTTESTLGIADFTRDFPAINNATTTIITASFAGDNPASASAISTAADGTSYAACTTVQYNVNATTPGYQPSSNTITLTVGPHSTLETMLTETPEQMQQDAQNSGWLSIHSKWSWGIPWYRLHFVLNVPLSPYGTIYVDCGFSPLPFGTSFDANATVFVLMLNDIGTAIATDVTLGLATDYIIQRVAAGLAGRTIVGNWAGNSSIHWALTCKCMDLICHEWE